MGRGERVLLSVWLALSGCAAIALLFAPLVSLLILLVITIPVALLINLTPTLWLYLTPALLIYSSTSRAFQRWALPKWCYLIPAALIPLAAGYIIPTRANERMNDQIAAVMKDDIGTEPLLKPVGTVALLGDVTSPLSQCSDECQRLLFSGFAKRVIKGPLYALDNSKKGAIPLIRHEIMPISDACDNSALTAVSAHSSEFDGPGAYPLLWEKLQDFADAGLCFQSAPTYNGMADLYLIDQRFREDRGIERVSGHSPSHSFRFDWAFGSVVPSRRRTIIVRRGNDLIPIMRKTQAGFQKLAVPLQIEPPHPLMGSYPHWKTANIVRRGEPPAYDLPMREWLLNDLRIFDR